MAMEKFTYTLPDGKKVSLPRFNQIRAGLVRKVRKEDAGSQIFSILEEVASEDVLAKLDDLESSDFNDFVRAWQEDARVGLGESSASTDS